METDATTGREARPVAAAATDCLRGGVLDGGFEERRQTACGRNLDDAATIPSEEDTTALIIHDEEEEEKEEEDDVGGREAETGSSSRVTREAVGGVGNAGIPPNPRRSLSVRTMRI